MTIRCLRLSFAAALVPVHQARKLIEPRGFRGLTRSAGRRQEGVPLPKHFSIISKYAEEVLQVGVDGMRDALFNIYLVEVQSGCVTIRKFF